MDRVTSMKTYLATIPKNEVSKHVLIRLLRIRARGKRWQFGIEEGHTTGYEHYQVRYESSENDYARERAFWSGYKLELQEATGWSEYERKSGCFYSYEDDYIGKYRFGRLRELQHCILKHGKQGDRTICAVVDKHGGIGKTYLARWMCLNGQGNYIDGSGRASDIIASVYDLSVHQQITRLFVDLTRNQNPNRSDLWNAIEQVKNGYLKDSRYTHREKWISPPEVFVFTNKEPSWNNLSNDRWDKVFFNLRNGPRGEYIEMWDRDKNGNPRTRNFYRNN